MEPPLWKSLWTFKGVEARRKVLETVFSLPPQAEPGTQYVYSNFGYALAGHMAEKVVVQPWEDLMGERLFNPLGMSMRASVCWSTAAPASTSHAATRPTASRSTTGPRRQPRASPRPRPIARRRRQLVGLHLRVRGEAKLLKARHQELHTPPDGSPSCMGRLVGTSPLGNGAASVTADNTIWYGGVGPPGGQRSRSSLCATRGARSPAEKACDEVSGRLIRQFVHRWTPVWPGRSARCGRAGEFQARAAADLVALRAPRRCGG